MALSVKQEKFCLEYAKLGNARQAYINAGYECTNENTIDACASRLLSNAKVKTRLAELTEETKNNAIADIQEMQEVLTEIIRQVREEEVIVNEIVKGNTTTKKMKKKASIKEVISAIEKLGKMQGAFIDKTEVNMDISPIVIKDDVVE